MAIETTTIAINRYAPAGSEAINLYSNDTAAGLTLGQLVIAVSIRSAAVYESQSVLKMNVITDGSDKLEAGAKWLSSVADGTAYWPDAKAFAINTLGVEADALPDALDTYNKRMQAVAAFKAKVDALAQQQQQDMIDLQTLVNRRDVAYSTSSNVVRALSTSMNSNAQNF